MQTKTSADGMEYRGRNGGRTAQDRKGRGTTQGRSSGNAQGRNEGKTAQDRTADRTTQDRQGKEQEVRQSVNKENRMYAQYRKTKAEKEATIKKKPPVSAAVVSVAARTALVNKNWTLKLFFFTYNLPLLYSCICFPVLPGCKISQ